MNYFLYSYQTSSSRLFNLFTLYIPPTYGFQIDQFLFGKKIFFRLKTVTLFLNVLTTYISNLFVIILNIIYDSLQAYNIFSIELALLRSYRQRTTVLLSFPKGLKCFSPICINYNARNTFTATLNHSRTCAQHLFSPCPCPCLMIN